MPPTTPEPIPEEALQKLLGAVGDFIHGGTVVPLALFRAYLDVAYTPWGQKDYAPRQKAPEVST
jgi:hypothetical protein